jgi:hypothetical protein
MKFRYLAIQCVWWCLVGLYPFLLWAAPPNVVLNQSLHFSTPDGTSVIIGPGKFLIEQSGPTKLTLTPAGGQSRVTIQARSLTHEQYELFSPMSLTRPQKEEEYLVELLLPGGVLLQAKGTTTPPSEPTTIDIPGPPPSVQNIQEPEEPSSTSSSSTKPPPSPQQELETTDKPQSPSPNIESLPFYRAPNLAIQVTRVVIDEHESGHSPLYLAPLSPDHIGLTMFEQPTLFWFIAHPTTQPVDLRITDEEETHMVLDIRMLPPIQPGIHKVALKDYGIHLQPHITYQWNIILQGANAGEHHSSTGWLMRIPPPSGVTTMAHLPVLDSTPAEPLIQAGLWYDALWALSERIRSHPTDSTALMQRASLFEQVGLLTPAQQDRARIPPVP